MSSIVRDRIQLTTCWSTTVASPFSSMPISRCRRSTLLISQQRLTSSVHMPVSAVSLRSSSCCTGQARSRCTGRQFVNERLLLLHPDVHWRTDARVGARCIYASYLIVSYRDILCDIDRIVSFPLRPYHANTSINWSQLTCLRSFTLIHCCFPVKSGEVLAWLSGWSEVQMICIWSADATATPSSLAAVKSRMVYLSGAGLPKFSWKNGR